MRKLDDLKQTEKIAGMREGQNRKRFKFLREVYVQKWTEEGKKKKK